MNPITFEYALEFDEFVEAYRHLGRRPMIVLLLIYAASLVFSVVWLIDAARHGVWTFVLVWGGFVAWSVWNLARLPRRLHRNLRPAWQQGSGIRKPQSVTLSDDGIAWKSIDGESRLSWSAFTHWQERNSVLVLFQGPTMPTALPKRAMPPAMLSGIKEMLAAKIGRSEYDPSKGFEVVKRETPPPS